VDATQEWRDQVVLRYDYGYSSDLDIALADAELADWQAALQKATAALQVARARLARVLGLPPNVQFGVAGQVPSPPGDLPEQATVTELALRQRPDLTAARLGITAAEQSLRLERRRTWQHVTLGPAYEHDPDGSHLWGLALEADLPLFDNNSAARARARSQLSRAENTAGAVEAVVREEVATAWEQLWLAMRNEEILRTQVLPARQRALDFTTRYSGEMQLNMLYMLEARRQLHRAQVEHLQALRALRAAEVELEFVVGGKLPAGGVAP
jgi:cobalt-zinc-cadmium efflux system outer membrane protein